MLAGLDADTVRRWCGGALEALRRDRDEIDGLNVFPVPDGDTGTNLFLTMTATRASLDSGPPDLAEAGASAALAAMARGALLGARGNSGIILAQFFRGLADALTGVPTADGQALAKALDRARAAAYTAVVNPVEGTMLTVATEAATAAGRVEATAAGRVE
ncbi:MAG: DAK2 domain-containing protein, partial [Dactylosporangium sp.]|nr:DAK2 domain-containing protein [Dactylosporangium sp.]NNJ60615.1 DAK2 domain-containing protein [Dactylosporangium sp.]